MECKLLLDISGFPQKLLGIDITAPSGVTKQDYVEEKIILAINNYNPKLNITGIEYENIRAQFPDIQVSRSSGLIVEDIEIPNNKKTDYENSGYYVRNQVAGCIARRIIIYAFFSDNNENGRDVLFTQSIFPAIIEYMGKYIQSPSYTVANHPIYFINIINKNIAAPSLIRRLASIVASNFEYIRIFANTNQIVDVPIEIKAFIEMYGRNYVSDSPNYSNDFFEIDFLSKKLLIKTSKLVVGEYLVINDSGKFAFHGSSEKFYWMEIFPIVVLAAQSGYYIDYTELELFCTSNVSEFGSRDDKFRRFGIFLQYIKKISLI